QWNMYVPVFLKTTSILAFCPGSRDITSFLPLISSEGFFPSTDKTLNCVRWIWHGCFIRPILCLTFSISQFSLRFTFCVKSILLGSNFLPLIVTLSSIPSNLIFLSTFGVVSLLVLFSLLIIGKITVSSLSTRLTFSSFILDKSITISFLAEG